MSSLCIGTKSLTISLKTIFSNDSDYMQSGFRLRCFTDFLFGSKTQALMAVAALFFLSMPVFADVSPLERMEGLVMPGDVIKKHARIEKDCDKCHSGFDRMKQNKQCMECHKDIANDIKKTRGFHGKIVKIDDRECRSCHSDHLGRDADIVQLDTELFDHNDTEFKLGGAHQSADCAACHKKAGVYRMPDHACHNCHAADDAHKERMGKKCENCHVEGAWLPAYFDHSRTKFKLQNAHREAACYNCHVNERYDDTPRNCYFCHFLDDVHKGDRGVRCHDCHTDERWSKIVFDHEKDAEFKLKGGHARLLCKDCHQKHIFEDEVETTCFGCHEKDDVHFKRYGKRCDVCHAENSWVKIEFNHKDDTTFPLKGKHKDLNCSVCHREKLFEEKIPNTCSECHRLDDSHEGQEGEKCQNCHNEDGWTKQVVFDHGITKFPLHESHIFLTCEDCHVSNKYKEAKVDCVSCHEKDDTHEKKLGAQCELCHRPSQWMAWEFDHNKQTDYPLDGKHDGLDCHACHKDPVEKEFDLPKKCYGCHEKDDVHNGQLGKQCETCHITASFKTINIK